MVVLEGRFARGLVVAGLAALALFVGGCGSDDDGGGAGGGGGSAAAETASDGVGASGGGDRVGGEAAGGDAAQIRATFKTYVDSLFAGDYEKACDQATAAERHAVRVISKLPCEVQFRSVFKANPLQPPKPRVMSVKVVDGENAIAGIDTGDKSKPYRMRMRKVGGVWKIDNSLVTDASRRQAKQEGRL